MRNYQTMTSGTLISGTLAAGVGIRYEYDAAVMPVHGNVITTGGVSCAGLENIIVSVEDKESLKRLKEAIDEQLDRIQRQEWETEPTNHD